MRMVVLALVPEVLVVLVAVLVVALVVAAAGQWRAGGQ